MGHTALETILFLHTHFVVKVLCLQLEGVEFHISGCLDVRVGPRGEVTTVQVYTTNIVAKSCVPVEVGTAEQEERLCSSSKYFCTFYLYLMSRS